MKTVAAITPRAAKATEREVPAAHADAGNRKTASSSIQSRLPDMRPAAPSDDAAKAEEAEGLTILSCIMFGIMLGALAGLILTLALFIE